MPEKSPSELINEFFVNLNNSSNLDMRKALSGDFSGVGGFSPIGQKFVDGDEFLFDVILTSVARLLDAGEFGRELVEFKKSKIAAEISEHYANLENEWIDHKVEVGLIESKEGILECMSIETLEVDASSLFCSVILSVIGVPSKNQTEKNYFYAYLLGIAYEKFSRDLDLDNKYNKVDSKENLIHQYYMSIDVDIEKIDKQFRKYDLYSVDDDCEIFVALPSRIIDKSNNLQFIVEMQKALLQMLVDAKESGYIEDLALLAKSQNPIESDERISILLGTDRTPVPPKIYDIFYDNFPLVVRDVIESRSVSEDELFSSEVIYKFHEIECEDAIWVFSRGNSVEFEEILGDPEVLEDCVVTQMIHLEYVIDDGRVKISHIDHEYLFYGYEEYDQRLRDYNQRAGAKKRIKTFKVDRSRLPLVFEDGTFSLYAVLDAYFKKSCFLKEFLVQGCGRKDVAEMVRQLNGSKSRHS
ncbi:hypothetical protein BLA6863_01204 [Burkholderia lata]|uniref:Uncharacterized protein n=2 Tax=Burkholderia lata (strain ATCC 17760 / DSM 23089 / LMG 22485 / NCIMB 9086 / R18194 / 383) TaxID=482957 RepID=A0A6P2ID38_BURL3|nr:hypothetical protein BLA6863_01204 [Burkholderia lata]